MICLRSYPTPEVIRNCKRLSPLEEEQVQCVRLGKTEAEIDACNQLFPGSDGRLNCLERVVSAQETLACREQGGDSEKKLNCIERAEVTRNEKDRRDARDVRRRLRSPTSTRNQL